MRHPKYFRTLPIFLCSLVILISLLAGSVLGEGGEGVVKLRGYVLDRTERPLVNVTVLLRPQNNPGTEFNTTSGPDGSYEFPHIPPGNYSAGYLFEGSEFHFGNVTVSEGESRWFNITVARTHDGGDDNDEGDEEKGNGAGSSIEEDSAGAKAFNLLIIVVPALIVITIVAVALFSRIRRHRLLDHENRQMIHDHIRENPGEHFSAIKRDLDLSTGVLSYHLKRLEKGNFISSRREGKYKRFYPPRWERPPELTLTRFQKSIITQIRKTPGINQSILAERLGRNKKSVNYNVHQLRDEGLLYLEKDGRVTRCYYQGRE